MIKSKSNWFVEFPTYQYNEDVKAIASKNGLRVIDAKFDDGSGAEGVELTIKGVTVQPKVSASTVVKKKGK